MRRGYDPVNEPTNAARILVVEDDDAIREGLVLNLELEGYRVCAAATGDEAISRFSTERPELVLLDVMLPGRNGFEVLRHIRATSAVVPVILLTARTDEADKVLGLELGADDYVTKPFTLGELRARLRAALRRAGLSSMGESGSPANEAAFADVKVERAAHRVLRAGVEVTLTAREFSLLLYLVDKAGQVLSRDELLRHVWGLEFATLRTVDNFVMRLRSKLEPDPERPRHFVTVRGAGYRFEP